MSETTRQQRSVAGTKNRRRWAYLSGGLAVSLLACFALICWFTPTGTGESRLSPDGRFEAHALNMNRGTLLGDWDRYVELRVIETTTGRQVWHVVHSHPPGSDVPDYGRRGMRFITWAADSSVVTIPVAGRREMTFSVP